VVKPPDPDATRRFDRYDALKKKLEEKMLRALYRHFPKVR